MKIGYVRVSKHEQNESLQIDALKAAGCEKWFVDKITGSKAERKGLNEALAYVRPGDTFMVWKLNWAGRSLKHLIELLKNLQGRNIEFVGITEQIDTADYAINNSVQGHILFSLSLIPILIYQLMIFLPPFFLCALL